MKYSPFFLLTLALVICNTISHAQNSCAVFESKNFQAKSAGNCNYYYDCYGENSNCRDCTINSSICGLLRVPIQFFVILDNNGNGDIDSHIIDDNVAFLNNVYREAQMEFIQNNPPQRINSNALFNFTENSECGGTSDENLIPPLEVENVINIFLTEQLTICGNNYGGAAYMPNGPQWMIIVKENLNNMPEVLAHELGHFFGLFHTHRNYNNAAAELADGSNCDIGGDRICDTPADPRLNINSQGGACQIVDPNCDCNTVNPYTPSLCVGKEPCTYNGPPDYNPDMGNIMSYTPWTDCPRLHFTTCQSKKMRDVLYECQSNLCVPPPPPSVFDPNPITYGEPIPPIIAIDPDPQAHTGSCFNWYDAPSGGNLLALHSAVLRPAYGSGAGEISTPGTYEYWVEMTTPYNNSCKSSRSKITLTINTTQTSTTDFRLKAKVILQGPYNSTTNTMNNSLRTSEILPLEHPFNTSPFNYTGTERASSFATIPNNVVDWVLVELRTTPSVSNILERQAAWVTNDGTLIDMDGIAGINFEFPSINESYYIVIRSRNHLPIMSAQAVTLPHSTPYDFTQINQVMGGTVTNVGNGLYGMYAGDFDANGSITVVDYNKYLQNTSIINTYLNTDCNFDKSTTVKDFNLFNPNTSIFSISDVRY